MKYISRIRNSRAGKYTIIKCIAVVIGTLLLYIVCCKLAEMERGYKAIGGEYCILLIPFLCYIWKSMCSDGKKNKRKRRIK